MPSFDEIIAQRLYHSKSGNLIDHCQLCDRPLKSWDFFVIAKAYHRGNCVLETAQCMHCQNTPREHASEQSIENIMLYSGRRFQQFLQDPIQRKLYHLEDPSCLITGEILQPSQSFELYTFNMPGVLAEDENFLMIGPTAMEQMSELLSEETRRSWGRFIEELSPDNPEVVISPMFFGGGG